MTVWRSLLGGVLAITLAAVLTAQSGGTLSVPYTAKHTAAFTALKDRLNAATPPPSPLWTAQSLAITRCQQAFGVVTDGEAQRRYEQQSVADKYRNLTDAQKTQVEALIDSLVP